MFAKRKCFSSSNSTFNPSSLLFVCLCVWVILVVKVTAADRLSHYPAPCDRSRRVFTEPYGEISDGPAGFNYTQDSHCEWLIKAHNSSQFITLTFHSMSTECSYDYIYVYDGDSFNSTMLGSFSGRTRPQRLVARSGSMLILMYSDTNYVLDGFRASYYISNCLNNCHSHGKCVGHQCVCHGEWVGPDCEDEACPEKCGEPHGRGKCVKGVCHCEKGYSGRVCDLNDNPAGGSWRWLATDAEGMTPRAAHTATYVDEEDAVYVFGGYDLNNVVDTLQIYRFASSQWLDEWGFPLQSRRQLYHPQKIDHTLLRAVLQHKNEDEAKLWGLNSNISIFRNILYTLAETNLPQRLARSSTTVQTPSLANTPHQLPVNATDEELSEYLEDILEEVIEHKPGGRYGHAAERVDGGFVIFGGKHANGSFYNDFWFYNTSESGGKWRQLHTASRFQPPPMARHTLTRAGDYLYLFGGSLETGEFSSKIYRIRLLPVLMSGGGNDGNSTDDSLETESGDTNNNNGGSIWELIHPRGGKLLDVRLAAHSTIYYKATNSLIVFGGIMTSLARFSKLSDRIYAFQLDKLHWTEVLYPRTALRDTNIPRERAFHTATISGNYMIVFGGYTHRHNKDEICYDNQMYWYHLSCHIWINQVVAVDDGLYPKLQGVFAHAATLRNHNSLLIVGGYHGNVNADLFAYELPQVLRVQRHAYNAEASCRLHTSHTACLSNPECGWCSADSSCYGRTIGANCTTNLQTTRCPGICPSLGDCHACLVHGTQWGAPSHEDVSVASKLGLNECTWCVQNAKCHHRDDNYGICGEDTPSRSPGWWGEKGTEIRRPSACSSGDRRPGLTYIKYHYPVNLTMPDYVAIVNATMVDFATPMTQTNAAAAAANDLRLDIGAAGGGGGGEMLARLLGFVRPQKNWEEPASAEIQVCTSYSTAILRAGLGRSLDDLQELTRQSANQTLCSNVEMPSIEQPFLIDFQARRRLNVNPLYNAYQKTKMELQHMRHGNLNAFTFEYLEPYERGNCGEYTNCLLCLADASCGWCDLNNRCLDKSVNETIHCRMMPSDSSDSEDLMPTLDTHWAYLITQPAQCANCSNFIGCEECVGTHLCEWWTEDARCARIGKLDRGVRAIEQCPQPCRERATCEECVDERGRCVWCEARSQCFSFAVYTSEYQFGMCREWLDRPQQTNINHQGQAGSGGQAATAMPGMSEGGSGLPPFSRNDFTDDHYHNYQQQQQQQQHHQLQQRRQQQHSPVLILPVQVCKSCSQYRNCATCLRTLSCGWCFDRDNPIEGVCMRGDFSRPFGNCTLALQQLAASNNAHHANTSHATSGTITSPMHEHTDAEYAYAQCPDVDECGLGLHDCHKEAKCTNTHGSFNCHCRRGYVGDGRLSCVRTCYDACIHGHCSGAPEYLCQCQLGWTGRDCSVNCGCHNHSTCVERVGKCDQCQSWTEGERCERCRPGSYGNATAIDGCRPCECNGHGNQDRGICDVISGECYCKDNTIGSKCEKCAEGYYGDPSDGGQCYFQCESRGVLTQPVGRSGIGSYKSYRSPYGGGIEVRECLWILEPKTMTVPIGQQRGLVTADKPLLQLEFEWSSLAMDCDENAVYVYDSLPDLTTGAAQQNQLIAVVCSPFTAARIVEARSNHVTVYYKQSGGGNSGSNVSGSGGKVFGFNAIYSVKSCAARTCQHPHICDDRGRCVCPSGYVGAKCEIEICPRNCNAKRMQGYCDTEYGRCVCHGSYAGPDCGTIVQRDHLVVTELFNTQLLGEAYEHLRNTIPRFGHSVNADRRGSLWMFGGYSPSHGPLNDFRQFDTKNGTWLQVTVDSTPGDRMPLGRYFHAAEIFLKKQTIFIYGGITIRHNARPHVVSSATGGNIGESDGFNGGIGAHHILGDFWQFSVQNQRWSEIELASSSSTSSSSSSSSASSSSSSFSSMGGSSGGSESRDRPPPLAGHTLTHIRGNERDSLLLIGGQTRNKSRQLELWEFNLETQRWEQLLALGVRMPVLYGHSAVYHAESHIVYVFGGYANDAQNTLYALNLQKMTWTELPPFRELNQPDTLLPRARYFHSAVTTDRYMIVYGGRTQPYNATDVLIAYVYDCNQWVRLTENVRILGRLPQSLYAEAIALEHDGGGGVYVIGGWDGSAAQSHVTRISLPTDICELWSEGGEAFCTGHMGCSFCRMKGGSTAGGSINDITELDTSSSSSSRGTSLFNGISHCFSEGNADVCHVGVGLSNLGAFKNGTLNIKPGNSCDDAWMARRDCSTFATCSACLASWPTHVETAPACQWCDECGIKGRCVPSGVDCKGNSSWCHKEVSVGLLNLCPPAHCYTLHCESCLRNENCEWAQNELGTIECISKELVEKNQYRVIGRCPRPCHTYHSCGDCLSSSSSSSIISSRSRNANDDADLLSSLSEIDNPRDCKWSTMLGTCLSPPTQPLLCAGGVCGLVLEPNETAHCPEPCHVYRQCSSCLQHAHCGWCARENHNGDGVCTEGALEHKQAHPSSSTCDLIYASWRNETLHSLVVAAIEEADANGEDINLPNDVNVGNVAASFDSTIPPALTPADVVSWHYVQCPAEDECANEHHNCDPVSQRCIDAAHGYRCVCGDGYRADADGTCTPVCPKGCVRGRCIRPDKCACDFGYVGANCSIQCQCNGHSDCEGPDRLDTCKGCHNNTMGAQCERCQPLFVGDPREGGECVPCSAYCYGHTDVCVARDSEPIIYNMSRDALERILVEGPTSNATCLRCANNTAGERCDTCLLGYFRGTEDQRRACRACQCHGHGNVCDPVSGEKCNCGNNTESDATCTAGGGKNSAQLCWSVQCSKCRDSYAGNPIDGHQCYKQITVESRMCFDAKPIEECKAKPAALRPGQTVFFVIQPRFMNVDIRIIIDVTQGELDVFMSPQDDSFIVETNATTGYHDILLDHRYNWVPPIQNRIHPLNIAIPKIDNATSSISNSGPQRLISSIGSGDATANFRVDSILGGNGGINNIGISSERRHVSFYAPHMQDCKSHGGHSFYVRDQHAKDLSTHVTLQQCNTVLRLFGLKNRLVLTLPQNAHNLSATRFFIALRANAGPEHSSGSVVFRQDQLHIDLFVFFSVFFSCFFLFLAVCVVVWKVKQASDLRRARRQHVVEMLHLAKRPFARVFLAAHSWTDSLTMETNSPPPQSRPVRSTTGARSRYSALSTTTTTTGNNPNTSSSHSSSHVSAGYNNTLPGSNAHAHAGPHSLPDVLLVAIEPTADAAAAVGTIFVSLPGRYKAPLSLAIGSALIVYPRQYSLNTRYFMRGPRVGGGHGTAGGGAHNHQGGGNGGAGGGAIA